MHVTRPMNGRGGTLALTAGVAAVCVLLAALVAAPARSAPASSAGAAVCTPSNAVNGIIDDSGSLSGTDSDRFRVQALQLFIDSKINDNKTLAASEFGGAANAIFGPTPINAGTRANLKAALDTAAQADNGGTDYNAGFAFANALYPDATSRIFLTDGEHNEGPYGNGHNAQSVPTYVIGFGITPGSEGEMLLQRIAAETGGRFFILSNDTQLLPTVNEITALLACKPIPRTVNVAAPLPGKAKNVTTKLSSSDEEIQAALFTGNAASSDFDLQIKERAQKNRGTVRYTIQSLVKPTDPFAQSSEAGASGAKTCKVKTKKKLARRKKGRRKPKRPKANLKISCVASQNAYLIDVDARRGSIRKATGSRLRLRVETDEGASIPFGTELTGQFTRESG